MQPPRMLPLLISVLAIPISLSAARLLGVSGMVVIMAEDLAKLSQVHFIIAEAGVKAKVESMAAAINILMANLTWKDTRDLLAIGIRIFTPLRFRKETLLCAVMLYALPGAAPAPAP